jgi:hypothetical protein
VLDLQGGGDEKNGVIILGEASEIRSPYTWEKLAKR